MKTCWRCSCSLTPFLRLSFQTNWKRHAGKCCGISAAAAAAATASLETIVHHICSRSLGGGVIVGSVPHPASVRLPRRTAPRLQIHSCRILLLAMKMLHGASRWLDVARNSIIDFALHADGPAVRAQGEMDTATAQMFDAGVDISTWVHPEHDASGGASSKKPGGSTQGKHTGSNNNNSHRHHHHHQSNSSSSSSTNSSNNNNRAWRQFTQFWQALLS